MRNWVLGEYQEVEEDDQVSHDHARPRMLEIVAEVFTHPSSLWCCLSCMREDTELEQGLKPSLPPLLLIQTCHSSTRSYVGNIHLVLPRRQDQSWVEEHYLCPHLPISSYLLSLEDSQADRQSFKEGRERDKRGKNPA